MIFGDRRDAGCRLANELSEFANRNDVLVLGIPRGGLVVAFEIAKTLHAPLDVFLSRKLGVPGQEELAFGAVAAGGGRYLHPNIIRLEHVSPEQVERITARVEAVLNDRAQMYRGHRPPLQVAGRTVILVDDGIATGASMFAAVSALRELKPEMLVIAAPVAPASTCVDLGKIADRVVCLLTPQDFYAVGQFYHSFQQVTDEQVIDLLGRAV